MTDPIIPRPKKFDHLNNGFYNLQTAFYPVRLINIGTHMSLCRLKNGNFLVIDTAPLDAVAKDDVDRITNKGQLIEAVIATHPYHTIFFEPFHKLYPSSNIKWYGTSRHLSEIKNVPWETNEVDIFKPNSPILNKWESEGVYMSIPEGAEFINPGHFSCVFVFHRPSRTLHVDDTISYFDETSGFINYLCLLFVLPVSIGSTGLYFHPSMFSTKPKDGLLNTKEAAYDFKLWLLKLIDHWDFNNLCVAHKGRMLGGAQRAVRDLIDEYDKQFVAYSKKYPNGNDMDSIYPSRNENL